MTKNKIILSIMIVFLILNLTLVYAQSSTSRPCDPPQRQGGSILTTIINGWELMRQLTRNSCGNTVVSVGLRHNNLTNESLIQTYNRSLNISGDVALGVQDMIDLIDSLLNHYNQTTNITVYVSFPTPSDPSPGTRGGVNLTIGGTTPTLNTTLNGSMLFLMYPTHWIGIKDISNGRPINATGGITPPSTGSGTGGSPIPPVPSGNSGVIYDIEFFEPASGLFIKGNLAYTEFYDLSTWYIRTKGKWTRVTGLFKIF